MVAVGGRRGGVMLGQLGASHGCLFSGSSARMPSKKSWRTACSSAG